MVLGQILRVTLFLNIFYAMTCYNESVVSAVSKRYMRAGIGNERLVVCLSEYLPLCIVYRISSMSTIA